GSWFPSSTSSTRPDPYAVACRCRPGRAGMLQTGGMVESRSAGVLGLALGGGGARGLCHIGVVRVLEELRIRPDVVSGTSMGGLIGAFIAAGYTAHKMTEIATDLRWSKLIDWSPLSGRLV